LKRAAACGLGSIVSAAVRGRPVVALTFDDGPGPYTEAILDVLERHHASATFFVVGRKVASQRRLLRRVHDSGHAVGNHTFNHLRLQRVRLGVVWREIRNGRRAIEDAIGSRVSLFRPPFGEQTPQSILLARLLGHEVICWSSSGDDWTREPATVIHERIQTTLRPGSIVLLHDDVEDGDASVWRDRAATIEALSLLLEHLRDAGIRSVTVPDLFRLGRPCRQSWFHSTATPDEGCSRAGKTALGQR
jgi:peptidoglycan/xylan/chitin deacetylase (PgdA/CDA1 family)